MIPEGMNFEHDKKLSNFIVAEGILFFSLIFLGPVLFVGQF